MWEKARNRPEPGNAMLEMVAVRDEYTDSQQITQKTSKPVSQWKGAKQKLASNAFPPNEGTSPLQNTAQQMSEEEKKHLFCRL